MAEEASIRPNDRAFHLFLQLPPELRDLIYECLVVQEKPVAINRSKRISFSASRLRTGKIIRPAEDEKERRISIGHSCLALALTCRHIYSECAPVYYSKNTFIYHNRFSASFVDAIGSRSASNISSIQLNISKPWSVSPFEELTGLQRLEIHHLCDCYGFHQEDRLTVMEDLRGLFKKLKYMRSIHFKPCNYPPEATRIELFAFEQELNETLRKQGHTESPGSRFLD
ncbi:hypothetical protein MMC20_003933 [Loxospora ochrophaea]|nr:hypothetical protein [Loxospora ochrophaea]